MKKIVVVGNALIEEDYSSLVNDAFMVVRFNEARNYDTGFVGTKTDVLCIANLSHPARKAAKYATIKNLPFIGQVKTIWFPHFSELKPSQFWFKSISRTRFKKSDYGHWILVRNGLTDKNILNLGKSNYVGACRELNITASCDVEPSSGYLAIKYIIEHYPTDVIDVLIIGFSFSGSNAHFWNQEKANIQAWANQGLLRIL